MTCPIGFSGSIRSATNLRIASSGTARSAPAAGDFVGSLRASDLVLLLGRDTAAARLLHLWPVQMSHPLAAENSRSAYQLQADRYANPVPDQRNHGPDLFQTPQEVIFTAALVATISCLQIVRREYHG